MSPSSPGSLESAAQPEPGLRSDSHARAPATSDSDSASAAAAAPAAEPRPDRIPAPIPPASAHMMGERLNALAARLVATYERCSATNHLGHLPLPSYRAVVEILTDLNEVLYPGYGRRQSLNLENVGPHVASLLHDLHGRLSEQIARAYRHDCRQGDPDAGAAHGLDAAERAAEIAFKLLQTLPELRATLREDVRAAYDGDPAAKSLDEIIFCYPGLRAVTVHRVAHALHKLGVPLLPRMMAEYAHAKTGIDIHPGATIGERFFIDHGTGVVIGETTVIGNNVKIYQGVTLGALSFPRDEVTGQLRRDLKRHPTIEHDVVIYANATILGGDTVIGHHAVIGSSAWVTRSVEPHATITIEKPNLRVRGPRPPENPHADFLDYQI